MKKIIAITLFCISSLYCTSFVYAVPYTQYISAVPTPAVVTNLSKPVITDLEQQINRMLIDKNNDGTYDHLAPAVFNHGLSAGWGFLYWDTPGELISALSSAYPYLSPTLQAKVKGYLDSEIANYNPLTTGYFEPNSGKLGDQAGIRREPYPIDTDHQIGYWPGLPVTLQVAYPLWQYTYYTGDKRFITNSTYWNQLTSLYNSVKSSGVKTFSQIVGLTGFSRLATIKGDVSLANESAQLAANALSSNSFSTFVANSDAYGARFKDTQSAFMDGKSNDGCCTSVFVGIFAPELGFYLHDNNLNELQAYSKKIELLDPLWFMTLPNWGGDPNGVTNMENLFAPPHIGWTNFMIHAYGYKESQEKLISYIDFPSRIGDLYYINELVAAISAPSNQSGITPTSMQIKTGDANADGIVNGSDYVLWFTHYGQTVSQGPSVGDFNTNGKVDGADFVLWLTNYSF